MKLNLLSFALLLSSLPALLPADDDAIQAELKSRAPRPERDRIQRYFLPGSSRLLTLPPAVIQNVDQASELQMKLLRPNDPIEARIGRQQLRQMMDADAREDTFLELDLRSDLEREQLRGRVKQRRDFYPGGLRLKSVVDYDPQGRRTREEGYDRANAVAFSRRYSYEGRGATPKQIISLDANGVTVNSTAFTLSDQGLPLTEEQRDRQGLPVLNRGYRYNKQGLLQSFQEQARMQLSGLRIYFRYDANGRLVRRTLRGPERPGPVWITEFDPDYSGSGNRERREYMGEMGLGERRPGGSGFETRKALKYRLRFEGDEGRLYLTQENGEGNEAYFFEKVLVTLQKPEGWLKELRHMDKDGFFSGRESWDWDRHGQLVRHEVWGSPGADMSSESYSYTVDAEGNWTSRRSFGAAEPEERAFEYYGN